MRSAVAVIRPMMYYNKMVSGDKTLSMIIDAIRQAFAALEIPPAE